MAAHCVGRHINNIASARLVGATSYQKRSNFQLGDFMSKRMNASSPKIIFALAGRDCIFSSCAQGAGEACCEIVAADGGQMTLNHTVAV